MWLNELKIAIVEKNTDKLNSLMDEVPKLTDKKDLDSAICLLAEATDLVSVLKNKTQVSMTQMQKNIKFLRVTEAKKVSTLDITM